ncbi:uncharacterized protein LOC135938717 [Cloeon dipterum]|uniref:uncharacterized protein LOC135938717 n=1 Tax=Cloeon dipterum TaxID=197152 RepID=UPI00321FE06F
MEPVEILNRKVQIQEKYLTRLQSIHNNVQETSKAAKLELDASRERSERSEQELQETYFECKLAVSKLGHHLNSLHQQCSQLNNSLCSKDAQLLCRLPLEELRGSRNAVENDLKLFIMKQFQKKSGETLPNANSIRGQPGLQYSHLIIGTDKTKFDQQCRDLERLQLDLGETLMNIKINDAKNKALKAAINFIKTQPKVSDASQQPSVTTASSIMCLKNDIKQAAAANAANKANIISLGSLTVKETRLKYCLDRLKLVHKLMKKQIGVDKIVYHTMLAESKLTQEASSFLKAVSTHFKKETDALALAVESLEAVKANASPATDSGLDLKEYPRTRDFNCKSEEIVQLLTQHVKILQNHVDLLDHSGNEISGVQLPMLDTSVHELEKLHADFKSDVESCILDFTKTKGRMKMCQNMKPPVDLWQIFLTEPDKLAGYLSQDAD